MFIRKTVNTLALLSLSATLNAQSKTFIAGIEGGPGISNLRGNEVLSKDSDLKAAYSIGMFLQYQLTEHFALRSNLTYERKGALVETNAFDQNGNLLGVQAINNNFDYLVLPILFRASLGKKIKYFANIGPYMGYLIAQNTISKIDNMQEFTKNNTSDFKRLDAGISSGLGLSIPIKGEFDLSFEARNNLGLSDISEKIVVGNGSIKNNSTNFLVGLAYRL